MAFVFSSINLLNSFPVAANEKRPLSIIIPPQCFCSADGTESYSAVFPSLIFEFILHVCQKCSINLSRTSYFTGAQCITWLIAKCKLDFLRFSFNSDSLLNTSKQTRFVDYMTNSCLFTNLWSENKRMHGFWKYLQKNIWISFSLSQSCVVLPLLNYSCQLFALYFYQSGDQSAK